MATRIFSGLADGTLAVSEKPFSRSEPNVDVIYVAIGQTPVTCLMLLGDQVWCASGNTVAVIHAKTLDAMDTFSVSVNPYDHILSLIPSEYGIWISLRGSSILELWDPHTLNCRMLYDTRTDRYPQLRKEDDTYFNRARITSMLANGSKVWVGTGEGNLMVYEILESAQLKTPTELSPSVETSSSMSYIARPEKQKDIPSCELASKLRKVYHLHEINADYTEDCRQSVPGEHRVKLGSVKPKDCRTR
ncbi:C-Jun-amino-terminal kinase-interacting protein 3-like [Mercenaria mercenaria]|uniref:C-Jun-amino-terminal kinase-interacting protein 3-like n=1 Tax=Mercenaria mercenaria TaxID=6596 RepID=UPI00234F3CA5|nr:C-Jun-amino-terminal kinase-interacting protein 3-like [Mercenaria mercenaria]